MHESESKLVMCSRVMDTRAWRSGAPLGLRATQLQLGRWALNNRMILRRGQARVSYAW